MKLTAFLLTVAFLQVYAKGISQVTLSLKEAPVEKVFREIERQTGYGFLYTKEMLADLPKVTINVRNAPVKEVLNECFKGQSLEYSIENTTIVITRKLSVAKTSIADPVPSLPPPIEIHGKVVNQKGEPLQNVSVLITGTKTGTTTNSDGRFTLTAPDNKNIVLQISSVGYQTKSVKVAGQSEVNVTLELEISGLSNVVVIGYGAVKKSDLTGSVSTVKASDISSAPVASVDQALQGKAAGVQVTSANGAPGTGTTIRIRGGNSISASNEPLYVVDGFIGLGDLTTINPNDIASIEVLKDASATAIYGARGANGVVLITTKRGKAGKSSISVNMYTGFQHLPKEIPLLTGPELAVYVNEVAAFRGVPTVYPDLFKVTNTDWQKAMTRNASMQSANISISGGTDKATYYLSGDYFNQDGIILNSGFQRYQTHVNLDLKLTDWLSVGTNLNFYRTNTNNSKINLYDILKSAPTSQPIKDSNGNYSIYSALNGQAFENPMADALESLDNTYKDGLLGGLYVEASFKNGLQLRSTLNINDDNINNKIYTPGRLPLRTVQAVGGAASLSSSQIFNLENENTVSYTRNWGKQHINVLGGFTYQNEVDQSFSANASGFSNDNLTYNNLSTGNPLLAKNSSNYSKWTIISFLGRASYSFNNTYLLTASAREDESSRLAANYKHAFFPSAAFAWKLINENFMKNIRWISDLKFRISYGKTGNQAIGVYSTLPSLSGSNAWFNSQQDLGYMMGNIANPNLKWETTDEYDIGVDAGFLDGRISATVDVYQKKTHNLLLNVAIPGTTGYTSRLSNVGETQNNGVELMIDGVAIEQKNLSWDLSFNIAANRNKVLALGPGQSFIDISTGYRLIVGKPAPVFFGAVADGIYHTQAEIDALPPGYQAGLHPGFIKLKDVNGNGKYDGTTVDGAIIGNPAPKFFGGFSSLLRYKRFNLNMYFQYSYGNDIINSLGPRFYAGEYAANTTKGALNRWEPDNMQANNPRAGAYQGINVNSQAYSFAVQDGSFLRLKTLQLSYNLAVKKIKWLKGASIYATGSNLFILDNYTWGYDPEVSSNSTSPILGGQDTYAYPANRSFIFGVNLKF